VGVNILPEVQPIADIPAADDMLDEQNSPIARQFDQMIKKSNAEHHERIMQEMTQAQAPPPTPAPVPAPAQPTTSPADYWFLNQGPTVGNAQTIRPGATVPPSVAAAKASAEEAALSEQLKEQSKESIQISYGHLRTIQPLSQQHQMSGPVARPVAPTPAVSSPVSAPAPEPVKTPTPPVTHQPNPATLKYVNNDDLTVATIARQVNENPPDEIVISLH
jgi:hypothetical protein